MIVDRAIKRAEIAKPIRKAEQHKVTAALSDNLQHLTGKVSWEDAVDKVTSYAAYRIHMFIG